MTAIDAVHPVPGPFGDFPQNAAVACTHCTLPVPRGLIVAGSDEQFCCSGCRTAHDLLHNAGLGAFYRLRDSLDEDTREEAKQSSGAEYLEFDDPLFIQEHAAPLPNGLLGIDLAIEGLHCGACVWLLERLPRLAPSVTLARIDYQRRIIHIEWDPARAPLSAIASRLGLLGYPVRRRAGSGRDDALLNENRRYLVRVAVAGACAGNVMLISFALYGGMFSGMAASHEALFRWTSLLFGLLATAGPGFVFIRGALAGVRAGVLNMDLPIALGLSAGVAMGLINTVRGSGEVYFDTVTMLVFLLLLGRWLQFRQQARSSDSLALLGAVTPGAARRRTAEGGAEIVAIESIHAGDEVEVLVGDSIPVDGTVVSGRGHVDASLMTGESNPVPVSPGDAVVAGSVNLSAPIAIRVSASGSDTRIGRIMHLVEQASFNRPPIVRAADRIAQRFVAGVLLLGALTLLLWLFIDPSRAVPNAAALLIVTCPCALALATPLAIASGIGQAARRGILIKSGEALESLSRPGVLLLDKTGTVTERAVSVVRWHGDQSMKSPVAAIERSFTHPIARALAGMDRDPGPASPVHVQAIGSLGVEGAVDGSRFVIGSTRLIRLEGFQIGEDLERQISEAAGDGLTPIVVARDGEVRAVAVCGDRLRVGASIAVAQLRRAGWTVGMLSGDHPQIVQRVAADLGLEPHMVRGEATPEAKADAVGELLAEHERVVMVGDGINDAAALASATVGVAVEGGAEASLEAADLYLSRPGLAPLEQAIEGARRTMRVIRRNFAISLAYNAVCATLAISGLINPLIAAVIMPVSSLTVVTLSYRARIFPGARR